MQAQSVHVVTSPDASNRSLLAAMCVFAVRRSNPVVRHGFIMNDDQVIRQTHHFLRNGTFAANDEPLER